MLEWVRETFFPTLPQGGTAYETMIGEARDLAPGAEGVTLVPSFVPDSGPTRRYGTEGTLLGLGLTTERGHVYRAALEGLCFQLRGALGILKEATGFAPARLRVVGGGSKNDLWNQLRADVCRMPVVITERKEAAVIGSAIAAWVGAGRFESIPAGMAAIEMPSRTVEPSGAADAYDALAERYNLLAPSLKDFYTGRGQA